MGTTIESLYPYVRAVLGDFNAAVRKYSDDAIKGVVQMLVVTGQLPNYKLSVDQSSIEPALASPKDFGIILYRAALTFVAPNSSSYGFSTRALKERWGDQKLLLGELHTVLYEVEFGDMLASWTNFSTWLTSISGLDLFKHLTEMEVGVPIAKANFNIAGLTISTGSSS